MKNHRLLLISIIVATLLSAMTSCVTPKDVDYLQDMTPESQIVVENKYIATIVPYDELLIRISCYDAELAKPFNLNNNVSNNSYSSNHYGSTYLVDHNGNIQFPILGEIHVAGMTRLQLQDHIASMLRTGNYIADPFVMVRFANYKIFFLTPTGGKSITIPNEGCTFLEALALSGGLNEYTRRDKIAVLREVNGKMTMRYLDPRSSDVFNDPYFMLHQNDMILVETRQFKYITSNTNSVLNWVTLGTSLITTILSLAALTRISPNN